MLLFAAEPEALTHPYLTRTGAKRGAGLRRGAPGQALRAGMPSGHDFGARERIVATSRTKPSAAAVARRERRGGIDGPKPGQAG